MSKKKTSMFLAAIAALAAAFPIPASAGVYGPLEEIPDPVEEAKEPREKPSEAKPSVPEPVDGVIEGVPLSTLNAIAACESGGDPEAVNAVGYYGKYQFDLQTWAAVGGSGNPADASEAEQDYRAALLYNQAGPSPWPVCGV